MPVLKHVDIRIHDYKLQVHGYQHGVYYVSPNVDKTQTCLNIIKLCKYKLENESTDIHKGTYTYTSQCTYKHDYKYKR